jgi:hypothetical protein
MILPILPLTKQILLFIKGGRKMRKENLALEATTYLDMVV